MMNTSIYIFNFYNLIYNHFIKLFLYNKLYNYNNKS